MRLREKDGDDFIEIECPETDSEFAVSVLAWFRKLKRRQREVAKFRADIAYGIEIRRRELQREMDALPAPWALRGAQKG